MSEFWSWWVIVLAALTMGVSLFLFLFVWGLWVRIPVQSDGTTGHDWDGIREGLRNLPRWWVVVSAGTFLVALGYLVLYSGLGSFKGALRWSSPGELKRDTAANDAKLEARIKPWRTLTIEQMAANRHAVVIGRRLYLDNCAACHGRNALGNPALGAPDLTDDVWEYGGDGEAILTSILDGRSQVMPPWGKALGEDGVEEVASYVESLSGLASREWQVRAGKTRYDIFCTACHASGGVGLAMVAPNLSDHAWLYGGDRRNLMTSIRDGRTGVMPAWRSRLGEDQSRLIAAWVLAKGRHERPTEH